MDAYRDVLLEWNDGINRNLALMHEYFGPKLRQQLDGGIGATYVAIGRDLQLMWRSRRSGGDQQNAAMTGRKLGELGASVYAFNLEMLRAIQSGDVGSRAPRSSTTS